MTDTATPSVESDSAPELAQFKHSRASRWMHWINFPLLTIMIWSGLRIYWADVRDPFGVGIVGWHWFDLLPDWANEKLGLERRLARGMAFHFTFGWVFTINGIAYGLYLWRSREWRHLIPDRRDIKESLAVVLHDVKLRKTAPAHGRYNAAQKVSYTGVLLLGVLVVVSGLAILSSTQLNLLTRLLGGYETARTLHFSATIGFLVFFVVHIVQVIRSGWSNFASMISGYELTKTSRKRGSK